MRFVVADTSDTSDFLDALVPFEYDPVGWLAGWIGWRSTRAHDVASALILRREAT